MPRTIISAAATALLLVLAFPQTGFFHLAWVACVPWLLMIETKSLKGSFGWSYLVGFLFFTGTLGWFIYVTTVGAFFLIAYLSLYFALFGLAYRFFLPLPILPRLIVIPSVWVVLEFLRAHLISGFSWASLAHSQYTNTFLIQIADITGFYGVSFLIIMVNVLIVLSIKKAEGIRKGQAVVIGLLFLVLAYGFWRIADFPKFIQQVSVGVVQPNIDQDMKWDPRLQPWIVQKTINLSVPLSREKLDLIVWPETSLPGVVSEVPDLMDAIAQTAKQIKTPILMGAITDEDKQYFNSAYLFSTEGMIAGRYDKLHLVPFGEYIPVKPLLGWLGNIVGLEDFTPGKELTLLSAGKDAVPFGVLICFEDTVGYLRRDLTNAGARFFVNMTNDAWFKDTKAPFLHLAAAVFASVENKRSLVRSANTGVSAFIDPFGQVAAYAQDAAHKKTFISAAAFFSIPAVTEKTFYTKYADLFTYACFAGILIGIFQRRRYDRKKDFDRR